MGRGSLSVVNYQNIHKTCLCVNKAIRGIRLVLARTLRCQQFGMLSINVFYFGAHQLGPGLNFFTN